MIITHKISFFIQEFHSVVFKSIKEFHPKIDELFRALRPLILEMEVYQQFGISTGI